jgi:DedD protein
MADTQDTEITLGTGKMLALFFGLVALCAVFFGLGFKLGKSSAPTAVASDAAPVTATTGGARPSAVKPASDPNANRSADVAFYKASEPKDTAASAAAGNSAPPATGTSVPPADTKPGSADPSVPAAAPPQGGYYVQVAAVTKEEDAEALVDALKKKQYPAFSAAMPDKLFHIQVGPFGDIKNAEDMRSKLVADGYNPILKK